MTKRMMMMLALFLLASTMMFAQAPATGAAANPNAHWVPVASAISMAIASGLCGLAQGKAVAGAAEAMARNPGASAVIRFALLLGLVLIESLALYTLVVNSVIIFR